MEQISKEREIKQGVWIEPYGHTPSNLPPWCYTLRWDAKRRAKYLLRINVELKITRAEHEKAKKEKELRIKNIDEFITTKRNGFIKGEPTHLNKVIFEYVKDVGISLSDGKIVIECTYW